jgi:hypothetical protein
MTIHFDSWQSFIGVILGVMTIVSALSVAHWKLFAEPRLKKILGPYGDRLEAVSHVVRSKFPREYQDALTDINQGRALRSAL